eukprot:m.1536129 g.1536129  ORF g.1536129 m.1536129 type:complete len:273 (+) comp25244_c1_seq5:74-892(+)
MISNLASSVHAVTGSSDRSYTLAKEKLFGGQAGFCQCSDVGIIGMSDCKWHRDWYPDAVVSILVISHAKDAAKPEHRLVKWLSSRQDRAVDVTVRHYTTVDWAHETSTWPGRYSAIVLGGTSGTDKSIRQVEMNTLIHARHLENMPMLCICGGMQMVCAAVAKSAGHKGKTHVQLRAARDIVHEQLTVPELGLNGDIRYQRMYGIRPDVLPPTCALRVLCLDAAKASVGVVQHHTRPIVGLQGHPELSPEPVAGQVLAMLFAMMDTRMSSVH